MTSYDDFSFFKSYLIEKHEINQKNIQAHEDLEKNSNYSKHDFYLEIARDIEKFLMTHLFSENKGHSYFLYYPPFDKTQSRFV